MIVAAWHIFSYHHGELRIYHEGWILFLILAFIFAFNKDY